MIIETMQANQGSSSQPDEGSSQLEDQLAEIKQKQADLETLLNE